MKYFLFPRLRIESFGSPFRNEGSGIPENDSINNERYMRGMEIYMNKFKGSQF